nr:lysine-2,3-aminomutase-like protein [uncultured Gellertiella sp.]
MTGRTLHTVEELVAAGLLPGDRLEDARKVARRYAIGITPGMADLIRHPDDPIGLQFLPQASELQTAPEESADPIGDHAHSPVEGVVHRYPDRVLLKLLHVCPVYCRFCFRREMVGPEGDGMLVGEKLAAALAYIAAHEEIWEVILTGGDPLMLSPRRLGEVMAALGAISHVRIVRLHSRVPAVDPARIDAAMIAALRQSGKAVYLALHANHPREMTGAACDAVRRLVDSGIVMLSQTVLLKGVNDDPEVLAALMRLFVENRIKPYYLHHPDLAPGTAHFRLSIEEGQRVVSALRGRISGLCQPAYVLDIPGGHGKTSLHGQSALPQPDGRHLLTDFRGGRHVYPPEKK